MNWALKEFFSVVVRCCWW